jgi:hypothetical protein
MSLKEQLIQECTIILKRKDVQDEIKNVLKPFFGILFNEIYPYIFLCVVILVFCFMMLFIITVLLIFILKRPKKYALM